jgi:multiple sugar transport system permease protein
MKKNKSAFNSSKILHGWKYSILFLLPALIGLLIFQFLPMLTSLLLSFTEWKGLGRLTLFSDPSNFLGKYWVGIQNYKAIITSEEFWIVLKNTLKFILLYIPMLLFFALSIGMLISKKRKGSIIYRVLYYIPVITSWVAGSLVWRWALHPNAGIINNILNIFGISGPGWLESEEWAIPGIVMASLWKDMGYYGVILLGGLLSIDNNYYEAASIDGANGSQKFFKITIPLLTPVLFLTLILTIMMSFQIFTQVVVMVKEYQSKPHVMVMVERIYSYAFRYDRLGYACSYSWLLFIIIAIITYLQFAFQKKWVNYDD